MSKKVLLFDDDEDILSICAYVLTNLGWEVHTRMDCNNILDTLETLKPSIIFMDNSIRDHGGVIATQTIKGHAAFKKIPVIYLSANNQIKILTAKAGADAYLEKPFDIKDLEKVINSVISNNN